MFASRLLARLIALAYLLPCFAASKQVVALALLHMRYKSDRKHQLHDDRQDIGP